MHLSNFYVAHLIITNPSFQGREGDVHVIYIELREGKYRLDHVAFKRFKNMVLGVYVVLCSTDAMLYYIHHHNSSVRGWVVTQ